MKKLPIGVQDFGALIDDGYLYVDKTEQLHRLLQAGKYLFLSRPRRFGKSLLLSTIKAVFEGHQHLFKGLWIEDKISWQQYPVIYIDFNKMDFRAQPLEQAISRQMDEQAARNGMGIEASLTAKEKLEYLLETLGSNGHRAVVLIDEYDKAITDLLGDDELRLRDHVRTLKNFYGTLKSLDACIHFALITGVSKYGKVSIFSDLNNLYDVTTDQRLAALLGWTQAELEENFREHLTETAIFLNVSRETLLHNLRTWYNGYSWDGLTTLYNPFSILNFFQARRIGNFWFTTGTPTFLTRLMIRDQVPAYELERIGGSDALLESADVESIDLISLLFQTGYLTIKKIAVLPMGQSQYFLSFPNEEVRISFLKHLLAAYVGKPVVLVEATYSEDMRRALHNGDLERFFQILQTIFASVPYQIAGTHEAYFHSIVHVCLTLTGYVVHSEIPTNQGRMDAVLDTGERIYLFEFKLRESAEAALTQIRARGYPQRFAAADRTLTLVGVAFDLEARGVGEWKAVQG
jgi:hypothetical protein